MNHTPVSILRDLAQKSPQRFPAVARPAAAALVSNGFIATKDLPRSMRGGPTDQGFLAEITDAGRAELARLAK